MTPRTFTTFLKVLVAVGIISLSLTELHAQKYTGSPVTKARLIKAIQSKQFAVPTLVKQIKISGTDFDVTPAVESELLAVRANQQIIDAVRENYRYRGQSGQKPPATPVRDEAGENYDALYYQGVTQLGQLPFATSLDQAASLSGSVINLGNQAIKANAARPEAYALIGTAHLLVRNFGEAQRYCQLAVDRGGDLAFPVYHLSGTPHLEILHVGQGFVTVESNQKFFQFNGRETSNVSLQNNYMLSGIWVATFSMQTYKDGRQDVWHFAPGHTGTPQEANMIMQLISKNSLGGR
jgi:hypothetical protein